MPLGGGRGCRAAELEAEGLGRVCTIGMWAGQRMKVRGHGGEEGAQEGILPAARAPGAWGGRSTGMEGPRPGLDPQEVGAGSGHWRA